MDANFLDRPDFGRSNDGRWTTDRSDGHGCSRGGIGNPEFGFCPRITRMDTKVGRAERSPPRRNVRLHFRIRAASRPFAVNPSFSISRRNCAAGAGGAYVHEMRCTESGRMRRVHCGKIQLIKCAARVPKASMTRPSLRRTDCVHRGRLEREVTPSRSWIAGFSACRPRRSSTF